MAADYVPTMRKMRPRGPAEPSCARVTDFNWSALTAALPPGIDTEGLFDPQRGAMAGEHLTLAGQPLSLDPVDWFTPIEPVPVPQAPAATPTTGKGDTPAAEVEATDVREPGPQDWDRVAAILRLARMEAGFHLRSELVAQLVARGQAKPSINRILGDLEGGKRGN